MSIHRQKKLREREHFFMSRENIDFSFERELSQEQKY